MLGGKPVTVPYCEIGKNVDLVPTIDINVLTGSSRLVGRVAFQDNTLPVGIVGFVKVLIDGAEVLQQNITFSDDLPLDLDVIGKRRVTLQMSVPEQYRSSVQNVTMVFVDGAFKV